MGAAPILTILRDGETIKSLPIEGEAVLGRAEGCVIRLDDRAISRQHAIFRRTADGVQLEKKSDFAPILLNGTDCTSAIIKDGDVVNIGPYLLKLSISKEPPREPAPVLPFEPVSSPTQFDNESDVGSELVLMSTELNPFEVAADIAEKEAESPSALLAGEVQGGAISIDSGVEGLSIEGGAVTSTAAANSFPMEQPSGTALVDGDANTKISTDSKMSVRLVFAPGAANHTEFDLTQDEISIGRGKGCDIVLNDKRSSRKNAIIKRAGANFVLKDLNSANGTFINGVRINEQQLSGDDKVRIGEVEFEFKAVSADYQAREANFLKVPEESSTSSSVDFAMQFPSASQADIPVLPSEGATTSPANSELVSGYGQSTGAGFPMGDIAGIPGLGMPSVAKSGKTSLIQKYRNLPPARRAIWTVIIIAAFYFLFVDEDAKPLKKAQKKPVATQKVPGKGIPGVKTFESLSSEEQRFVEAQHLLAFDKFTKKDYVGALFDIEQIEKLGIIDYKDLKDIKRYAIEGRDRMEQIKKEAEARETEKRNKARVAGLIDEIKELMDKKDYKVARERFAEVLSLDPDNTIISSWRKELEDAEERSRLDEQQAQVQKEINTRAWEFVKEAILFKKKGKYFSAIDSATKVKDIGASDKKVIIAAETVIRQSRYAIQQRRDPLLAEAKALEDAGEFAKAYPIYLKAIETDPKHPAGYAGVNRISGILHDQAKVVYAEAVLAESYSDFSTARKKFQECMATAPIDDIYHQRAQRKLAHYFRKDDL